MTSVKSKKFLFCSFSVAKFGIAPQFPGRAHICHKYHKLYLWRKNCHVEKFGEILGILETFWEILGNFEKFWKILGDLPQFTPFHVEKNWAQKVHLWRKNDKYEVCFQVAPPPRFHAYTPPRESRAPLVRRFAKLFPRSLYNNQPAIRFSPSLLNCMHARSFDRVSIFPRR